MCVCVCVCVCVCERERESHDAPPPPQPHTPHATFAKDILGKYFSVLYLPDATFSVLRSVLARLGTMPSVFCAPFTAFCAHRLATLNCALHCWGCISATIIQFNTTQYASCSFRWSYIYSLQFYWCTWSIPV